MQKIGARQNLRTNLIAAAIFAAGVAFGGAAQGSAITFCTPPGATVEPDTRPVDACADFTTSDGQLEITLTNLLADPINVIQALSDLSFTLDDETLGSGTLGASAAQEITIAGDGTFTTGGTVATGWVLSGTGGSYLLDVLAGPGHAGPAHLIIGPPNAGSGNYDAANASIAGNGPHNPFLNQVATFTIDLTGITAETVVTSATFSFGTTAGVTVPGGPPLPGIPEPGTLLLLAAGLFALAGGQRYLRRR
jgi:hypothetical protein